MPTHTLPAPRVTKGACETHDDEGDGLNCFRGLRIALPIGALMWYGQYKAAVWFYSAAAAALWGAK